MNKIKSIGKKGVILLLVAMVLLSIAPSVTRVSAEEASEESSTTNDMISFFREDRTDLAVDRVSRDELMVYGVFLSNFFTPWVTKVGDISKESGIATDLSKQFFGSADKAKQVASVNKKLSDAITDVLGNTDEDFAMLNSSNSSKPMTGDQFLAKMASGGKIYSSEGSALLDLSDNATHASLQVLFGISPEFMVSKTKGMRKIKAMYMDGLGNIWGKYGSVDVSDYVLILPAALNPVVFSNSTKDTKFPVSNVFVQGAIIKPSSNFLKNASRNTPYYNIKGLIPTASSGAGMYNKNNTVNIYGVQSVTDKVGNTDSIIEKGYDGNVIDNVKDLVNSSSTSTIKKSEANILISVDAGKLSDYTDGLQDNDKLSKGDKTKLTNYLTRTSVLKYDDLADDMYYFNTSSGTSASDTKFGDWSNIEDLLVKQGMFGYNEDGGNDFTFYSGSYYSSPFSIFYKGYLDASDKNKYLKDKISSLKNVKTDSKEFKILREFFDKGTIPSTDKSTVNKAFRYLKSSKAQVFNLVEPSNNVSQVSSNSVLWGLIDTQKTSVAFGLTENDMYLSRMSAESLGTASYWSNLDSVPSVAPFMTKGESGSVVSGGHLSTTGGSSDEKDIAAYFYTANAYTFFSMNSTYAKAFGGTASGKGKYESPVGGKLVNKTAIMDGKNNYPGIYWGYLVDMLGVTAKSDGTGFDIVGYENNVLPYMEIATLGGSLDLNATLGATGVVDSEDATIEDMQKNIIKNIYKLLSEEQSDYRNGLIKSTMDGWVISLHRSITGSWVGDTLSVSTGGGGSYGSVVGYINTPSLTDIPLTSWLLSDYVYVYVMVMGFILVILVMMAITNIRRPREAILIFFIMSFVMIMPQFLVGNVINISNTIGDKIYSSKFNYWAIAQHEQAIQTSNRVVSSADEIDYIINNNMQALDTTETKDVGVRVKWMSPKKDDAFDKLFTTSSGGETLKSNLTIFRWLFNTFLNQEEYDYNNTLATYVYRPYNSIANEAKNAYDAVSKTELTGKKVVNEINVRKKKVTGLPDYRYKLITANGKTSIKYTSDQEKLITEVGPYRSSTDTNALNNYRYWVMNDNELTTAIFRNTYTKDIGFTGDTGNEYYNMYSLTTESPFYFFYNVFKHRYANNGVYSKAPDFKTALLSEEVFKVNSSNTKVDGRMRDFLDLEGLFTYVIPYMNQANEYVYGYTDIYGSSIDGYSFGEAGSYSTDINAKTDSQKNLVNDIKSRYASEEKKKKEMKNVWRLYTPWVDSLYKLDVMGKKVKIAGSKVEVEDTLNPASYESVGRPMVFSQADMIAKNYKQSDLSDVEMRIQETLDSTYTDLMYLTNYYDYDNETLITAAAMLATFNFDREFSETNFLGESVNLYPQNFELKNFNFDAFMRLTLLNATGEPLIDSTNTDLYERVLTKSSLFTGLALLLNDILGAVVIPTMKMIVLLLLFILTLVIALVTVIEETREILKVVFKHVIRPALIFLISNIVFAWVIALFMGDGLSSYVGSRTPSIGVTDPTIALTLMIIVDSIFVVVLGWTIKTLFKSSKNYGNALTFGSIGLIGGVAGTAVSSLSKRMGGGFSNGLGGVKDSFSGKKDSNNKAGVASYGSSDSEDDLGGRGDSGSRRASSNRSSRGVNSELNKREKERDSEFDRELNNTPSSERMEGTYNHSNDRRNTVNNIEDYRVTETREEYKKTKKKNNNNDSFDI